MPRGYRRASFLFLLLLALPFAFALEQSFTYDDNGNLISDSKLYHEYNAFNQLIRVRVGGASGNIIEEYGYGAQGDRIFKVSFLSDGSNTTTYYAESDLVREVTSSGSFDTVYYFHQNELVASKDYAGKLLFYHPDHLGSVDLVTDATGVAVETTRYFPFGELVSGGESRFTFTGKERDATDLMYYGARYYHPFFRRFVQPDTVLPDIYDPQQLNRYAYARNNPLKFTDPSGNTPWSAIGGVIGAGIDVISQILFSDHSIFGGTVDYGSAFRSGIASAVGTHVGMAAYSTVSPLFAGAASIASSAAAGAASGGFGAAGFQLASNMISGSSLTSGVYESTLFGATIGGVLGAGSQALSSISSRNSHSSNGYISLPKSPIPSNEFPSQKSLRSFLDSKRTGFTFNPHATARAAGQISSGRIPSRQSIADTIKFGKNYYDPAPGNAPYIKYYNGVYMAYDDANQVVTIVGDKLPKRVILR
jgi:RHS repeat-associated protein